MYTVNNFEQHEVENMLANGRDIESSYMYTKFVYDDNIIVLRNGVYIGHIVGINRNVLLRSNYILLLEENRDYRLEALFYLSREGIFKADCYYKSSNGNRMSFMGDDKTKNCSADFVYRFGIPVFECRSERHFGCFVREKYRNLAPEATKIRDAYVPMDIVLPIMAYYQTTLNEDMWTEIFDKITKTN